MVYISMLAAADDELCRQVVCCDLEGCNPLVDSRHVDWVTSIYRRYGLLNHSVNSRQFVFFREVKLLQMLHATLQWQFDMVI